MPSEIVASYLAPNFRLQHGRQFTESRRLIEAGRWFERLSGMVEGSGLCPALRAL